MPFNPQTGAWESGGDHAWTMPSTSTGDVVGAFNSYGEFQRNKQQQDLQLLMQQLQLQEGQAQFGQQQDQWAREDKFRQGLQPTQSTGAGTGLDYEQSPAIQSEEDLDTAMMGLDPKSAYGVINRRNTQKDNLRYQQGGKRLAEYNKAVQNGADPRELAMTLREEFPDMPQLADALERSRINPKTMPQVANIEARTGLANTQKKALEQMTPISTEARRLQNDILRYKKAAAGVASGQKPMTEMQKLKLKLQILRQRQSSNNIMTRAYAEDIEVFDAADEFLEEAFNDIDSMGTVAPAPAGAPAPSGKKAPVDPLGVR